jgi:hypothetical protein
MSGMLKDMEPKIFTVTQVPHSSSQVCDLCATAVAADSRYGVGARTASTATLAYVVSEGRLFALNPSDWAMLLVGVVLSGFVKLLFGSPIWGS